VENWLLTRNLSNPTTSFSKKKKKKKENKKRRQNFECAETEKDCIDPSSMEFKPLHT
jgi:hypothetical protein